MKRHQGSYLRIHLLAFLVPALLLCSIAGVFTQMATAPAAPTLAAPSNGAINVPAPVALRWNAPGADSYTYWVQVSRNEMFTDVVFTTDSAVTTSVNVAGLAASTRYWWRVKAFTDAGQSAWSAAWSFTMTAGAPLPAKPVLAAPINGTTNVSTIMQVRWSPAERAQTYVVQLARSEGFTDGLITRDGITGTGTGYLNLLANTRFFWRVKAVNVAGSSAWSTIWSFTTGAGAIAPATPMLRAPANGATNVSIAPRLSWAATERATAYVVQYARNEAFSTGLVTREQVTATATEFGGLLVNTRYFWHVKAVNSAGASAWSTVWSFTTGAGAITVPTAPVLAAPANGTTNVPSTVRLSWNPVERAVTCVVQLACNEAFTDGVVTREGLTANATDFTNLAAAKRFFWRVKGVNSVGAGPWSTVWSFTTAAGNVLPAVPTLLLPANGATGVITSPRLSWNSAARAVTYIVQLSRYEGFSEGITREGVTNTATAFGGLMPGIKYFWRVKAVNSTGQSAWSAVWSFTTAPLSTVPAAPVLVAPANGASDTGTAIHLMWLPAERANSYNVEVSRNEAFTAIEFTREMIAGTATDFADLQPAARYFWRVRGVNGIGAGPWSTVWTFATGPEDVRPPAPELVAPEDGITGIATSVRLVWRAADRATGYILQVSTTEGFTNLVVDRGYAELEATVTDLTPNVAYFWHVCAYNSAGQGPWSATRRFSTVSDVVIPPVPELLAPENGAQGVVRPVRLTWKASQGATSYVVQAALNEGFTVGLIARSVLTTYFDATSLQAGKLYFWRVRAINSAGTSAWSAARKFTTKEIEETLPGVPVLVSPAKGATDLAWPIILTWKAAARATSYDIQVARNEDFTEGLITKNTETDPSGALNELQVRTQYFWRVRGVNAIGTSAWSTVWHFTTGETTTTIPDVPTLATPTNEAGNVALPARLTWNAAARTSSYDVQVSPSEAFTEGTITKNRVTLTSIDIENLQAGKLYYWRVRAVNAAGSSAWSTVWRFTTATAGGNGTLQAPDAEVKVTAALKAGK